ncbi:MAG: hypothetical protein L0229_07400 [Blastocatellia bacterium]|nr:hypothetical protein [Blastocatellia bacterium]
MPREELEESFPGLKTAGYEIKSEADNKYNCIAWALNHTSQFWDPGMSGVRGYYWPPGVPKTDTIESWIRIFEIHGYSKCDSSELEVGFDKVAIYSDPDGIAMHVARQL